MYCGEFTFGIGLSPCHRASSDPLHTTTLASTSLHSNPCAPYVHKYVWSGVRSRSRTCSLYGRLVSRCLPLASLHFHCVNIEIGLMSFCLWRGYTASPLFQSPPPAFHKLMASAFASSSSSASTSTFASQPNSSTRLTWRV